MSNGGDSLDDHPSIPDSQPSASQDPALLISLPLSPTMSSKPDPDSDIDRVQRLLLRVPDFASGLVTLGEDGANFTTWLCDIEDGIEALLRKPLCFSSSETLSVDDNTIIRFMLKGTLPVSVWSNLRHITSSRDIVEALRDKFHDRNRATHLTIWQELVDCRFDPDGSTSFEQHCSHMSDLILRLERSGFIFNKPCVTGLLLQGSLPASSTTGPFMHLNRLLDTFAGDGGASSFTDVAQRAAAELKNYRLGSRRSSQPMAIAAVRSDRPPSTMGSRGPSTSNPPARSPYLRYKRPEEATSTQCFCCHQIGHWESHCPRKAAGLPRLPVPVGQQFQCLGSDKKEWRLVPASTPSPAPSLRSVVNNPPPGSAYLHPAASQNPFQAGLAHKPSTSERFSNLKINATHFESDNGDAESGIHTEPLWEGAVTLDNAATES